MIEEMRLGETEGVGSVLFLLSFAVVFQWASIIGLYFIFLPLAIILGTKYTVYIPQMLALSMHIMLLWNLYIKPTLRICSVYCKRTHGLKLLKTYLYIGECRLVRHEMSSPMIQ
jgi:hypothetical protein